MRSNSFLLKKKMKRERTSVHEKRLFTIEFRFKHYDFYQYVYYIVKNKKFDIFLSKIKTCLGENLKKKHLNLSVLLTNDKDIASINYKFRNKNKPTNILSFASPLYFTRNYNHTDKKVHLGDIVISMERIFHEANSNKISFHNHFIHIFMHGILHILGYDHQTDFDKKKMERKEISILKHLGISSPYE